MIRFQYALSSFSNFLTELASSLNISLKDNTLFLPPVLGDGYFKSVQLPNGLEALLIDLTFNQDMLIQRAKTHMEYYVFICEAATNVNRFFMHVDEEETSGLKSSPSAMYLLSFLSDLQQFASAGTILKSIRVIMSKEWLARYLRIEKMDEVLQRYLSLKARSFHIRDVDLDSRLLMNEIFQTSQSSPIEAAYLQNRIMKILENFFTWMYQQMSQLKLSIRLSRDEVGKLMEIETELINDLSSAPTINQLSRKAAMSPSKLKKQFKDVYGLPLYEYFQKHRMHKARELLLTGKHSIKEVGLELGYSNLSNFSLAFKKVFNQLPSELLKSDMRGESLN